MEDYKKKIYWVETNDGDEDRLVVGLDQYVAEIYFCENEGYPIDLLYSEEICNVDFEDVENIKDEAYYPSQTMLVENGFEVISDGEPTIYWRAGKKYCQGNIIRNAIIENGRKQTGVYIVAVRDSDLYKIGVTKDIEKRLYQLQTANPYEFYLMAFFTTSKQRELERLLHKRFLKKRYKREWYKLTKNELKDACDFAKQFIGRPSGKSNLQLVLERMIQIADTNNKQQNNDDDLPF